MLDICGLGQSQQSEFPTYFVLSTDCLYNKPNQVKMRPDCVPACIDFGAKLGRTDWCKDSIKRGFQNI